MKNDIRGWREKNSQLEGKRKKEIAGLGGNPVSWRGGDQSLYPDAPPRGMGGAPPSNCLSEGALVLTNGTEAFRSLSDSDGAWDIKELQKKSEPGKKIAKNKLKCALCFLPKKFKT